MTSSSSPRIAYFGVPLGARVLHGAGHRLVAACLGPLDLPGRRWARRALAGSLVLGQPDLRDPGVQKALASTRPELLLSFFWPKKIPAAVLAWAPAYGTHPSLLPRWRGPDPTFWAIRAGDAATGVTLHALEAEYDTGGVVATREIAIREDDTAWSLSRRLDRPALALLREIAERVRRGERIETRPQRGEVTQAPFPSAQELAIDWRQPADEVLRLVRAASPEPGAGADLGGQEVEVLRARRWHGAAPVGLAPAEAWRTPEGWAVRCGEGAVRLEEVRGADGRAVDLDALFASAGISRPDGGL